jgi:hypothetical protein
MLKYVVPSLIFFIALACVVVLAHATNQSLKLPVVQFSYKGNSCAQVINVAGPDTFTCNNLPKKYIHEWVQ